MAGPGPIYIISGFFGKKKIDIYPAPLCRNCIFFSNNGDYAELAREKGWVFEYVSFPKECSEDEIECSLQSKYIKFLIFLEENDFAKYRDFSVIIYMDHSLEVLESHIIELLDLHIVNLPSSILIREHENLSRTSIWDEIWEARAQSRYNQHMSKTITWIENRYPVEFGKVCNTGLILYSNNERIYPFLKDMYETCIQLKQPCCQIFWSVFSPKYSEMISTIPFRQIFPKNHSWERLGYFP
jgi:hypothetical protein